MTRIPRAVREEAIEALLCCADVVEHAVYTETISIGGMFDWSMSEAQALAEGAFWAQPYDVASYQEAAGLLLDGWSPGDPVVRRG